jgi:hypothetical protein
MDDTYGSSDDEEDYPKEDYEDWKTEEMAQANGAALYSEMKRQGSKSYLLEKYHMVVQRDPLEQARLAVTSPPAINRRWEKKEVVVPKKSTGRGEGGGGGGGGGVTRDSPISGGTMRWSPHFAAFLLLSHPDRRSSHASAPAFNADILALVCQQLCAIRPSRLTFVDQAQPGTKLKVVHYVPDKYEVRRAHKEMGWHQLPGSDRFEWSCSSQGPIDWENDCDNTWPGEKKVREATAAAAAAVQPPQPPSVGVPTNVGPPVTTPTSVEGMKGIEQTFKQKKKGRMPM